jgi:hypothetical protein
MQDLHSPKIQIYIVRDATTMSDAAVESSYTPYYNVDIHASELVQ